MMYSIYKPGGKKESKVIMKVYNKQLGKPNMYLIVGGIIVKLYIT